MSERLVRSGIVVVVVAMAVGCGGGSSGFSTGVPGNRPLGELSPAEAKTLCTNTAAYLRAALSSTAGREATCRAAGAFAASTSATADTPDLQVSLTCSLGYTFCLQAFADGGVEALSGGGDGGVDPCATATTAPASCTATVDQYTACVNENDVALTKTYPPCAELTRAKLAELMSAPGGVLGASTGGPACQAFTAACPGFNIRPWLPSGI